jgi:single-strand DNA-binding protein
MQEIQVQFTGNTTDDPALSYTTSGQARCVFSVAVTPRRLVNGEWKDGEPSFPRVTAWGPMAENVAESLRKGDRVIVTGVMSQRTYKNRENEDVTVWGVRADEIGISLKFNSANSMRARRRVAANTVMADPQEDDPWAGVEASATPNVTVHDDGNVTIADDGKASFNDAAANAAESDAETSDSGNGGKTRTAAAKESGK